MRLKARFRGGFVDAIEGNAIETLEDVYFARALKKTRTRESRDFVALLICSASIVGNGNLKVCGSG